MASIARGWAVNAAHPRSRGEHRSTTLELIRSPGSSPLARGTPATYRNDFRFMGLIPARAGNTFSTKSIARCRWAHPRSRGEHSGVLELICRVQGSSPLARGTLEAHPRASACFGLIPARAGNTFQCGPSSPLSRAHPRSRGEHGGVSVGVCGVGGSSPLARGTPSLMDRQSPNHGLIPARAGNTAPANTGPAKCRAHPRSRGEHVSDFFTLELQGGSSPLARGTLRRRSRFPRSAGLIPARAGNTA